MTHGCKPNGKFRKAVQGSPMSRISTTSITGSNAQPEGSTHGKHMLTMFVLLCYPKISANEPLLKFFWEDY